MYRTFDIGYSSIGDIRELWEMNRVYHEKRSEHFKELYRSIGFEEVIGGLGGTDPRDMKITVAEREGSYIGYCISVIHSGCGEVKSLHVDERYRGRGVGRDLVTGHLSWLRERECSSIGVRVSQENDSTISFYRSLGFLPNTLDMQLRQDGPGLTSCSSGS